MTKYEVELAVTRTFRVTVNAEDEDQAYEKAAWAVAHSFDDFFDQQTEVVELTNLDADDEDL